MFLFLAVESKRKRGIGGISRKGYFRRRETDQSHFFGKNRFWKRLTLKNLPKYEEKEPSSSIEDRLRGYKKSIFNHCMWYITQMTQLIMNYFQWIVIFQFIRGTNVFSLLKSLKSVNNLNPHFMRDYFKMNFFPYDLRKGNTLHLPPAHSTRHGINSLLFLGSLL